ncbi:MAG: ABC-2 type transport system ATP-binding protein [Chlamydiales bacterium]|jgi:ABC-2 type transport system ATP-binding protein
MTAPLLSVANLRVDHGLTTVVSDVSFDVHAGCLFGVIGPDGSAKTTLLSTLAGLIEPTHGSIRVCGIAIDQGSGPGQVEVGFMPNQLALHEDLTPREFLELFASAHGLARTRRRARIDEMLELFSLTEVDTRLTGELDHDTQRRVLLARALLHDPSVLLLDEPVSGMEPYVREELGQTLRAIAERGKAIIVSSPVLTDLQGSCTHVGIMDRGSMVISGRIADVLEGLRPGRSVQLSLVHPDGRLHGFLSEQPNVKEVEANHESAHFRLDGGLQEAAGLLRRLVESDFELAHFDAQDGALQEILARVDGARPG